MEALFKQYFWVVKGLGVAIVAALTASVLTTYVGSAYIYDDGEDTTGTVGETETDTEGDEDDEEEKPLTASMLGGGAAGGRSGGGDKTKIVQTIHGSWLFFHGSCLLFSLHQDKSNPANVSIFIM